MKDDWLSLDPAERFAIALAVARRRGQAWIRRYDNVVSVGAGRRLRGPGNGLVDEICLCFLVRRKWADRRERPQKIPPFVVARPTLRGRRLHVRIPTDVSAFSGGRPHGPINLTGGVTARLGGVPTERGATCCLVRDAQDPSQRFLLSCNHVFSATLEPIPVTGADCEADDSTLLGPEIDAASPDGPTAVDAALVRLDDASVQGISLWGLSPAQRATDFDLGQLAVRGQLFVLGRRVAPAVDGLPEEVRTAPIPAEFRAILTASTEFDYTNTAGRSFVFADTIEYMAAVRPGDSGAALVDVRGMVYGMHFYGSAGLGYAMAAPRLFQPGIFSRRIAL